MLKKQYHIHYHEKTFSSSRNISHKIIGNIFLEDGRKSISYNFQIYLYNHKFINIFEKIYEKIYDKNYTKQIIGFLPALSEK